jgi:hypothetical protein
LASKQSGGAKPDDEFHNAGYLHGRNLVVHRHIFYLQARNAPEVDSKELSDFEVPWISLIGVDIPGLGNYRCLELDHVETT